MVLGIGATISIPLSNDRQVVVHHEPNFVSLSDLMNRSDTIKIMSHLEKKKIFRTVRRKKRDGTTKSRVVCETLWWKMPDGTIESSDITHT